MSFPRYPKYKASGVEWLGEVPEGWTTIALKRIIDPSRQITYGIVQAGPHIPDGIPYIRPADMSLENGVEVPDQLMRTSCEIAADYKRSAIRAGDIVCSIGPSFGKVMIVPPWLDGSNLTQGTARIAVNCDNDARYVFWTLRAASSFGQWDSSVGGATFRALNLGPLARTLMPLPPLAEQTAIAEFLDRETAKIDVLVAEQRRLIALLKEKRQAVISHAVTKGLHPNAPTKPSGIPWLGDVPAHWEVLPLKRIVSIPITDGPHETPQFFEEGVPFVSAEAVSSGQIDFKKVRACISPEDNDRYSKKYFPRKHDIYMVKSGATTGVTAIVEDRTDFNIWSPLAVIRCNDGSVPHFVLNFMRSRHFLEAVTLFWSFGTQQNIGMGVIENLACTVPPVNEQHEIITHLRSELARFDELTAEAERAIDLLQERRTALISAAVTGQIDVRAKSYEV
jgi:type I restriction enzyme S subunit